MYASEASSFVPPGTVKGERREWGRGGERQTSTPGCMRQLIIVRHARRWMTAPRQAPRFEEGEEDKRGTGEGEQATYRTDTSQK